MYYICLPEMNLPLPQCSTRLRFIYVAEDTEIEFAIKPNNTEYPIPKKSQLISNHSNDKLLIYKIPRDIVIDFNDCIFKNKSTIIGAFDDVIEKLIEHQIIYFKNIDPEYHFRYFEVLLLKSKLY